MLRKISVYFQRIIPILKKNGAVRAGVFGSFARGEFHKKSDIDLVIKLKAGKTLLDLVGLEMELEKKMGRKIDLLTYDSIHPLLKKNILSQQIRIL